MNIDQTKQYGKDLLSFTRDFCSYPKKILEAYNDFCRGGALFGIGFFSSFDKDALTNLNRRYDI